MSSQIPLQQATVAAAAKAPAVTGPTHAPVSEAHAPCTPGAVVEINRCGGSPPSPGDDGGMCGPTGVRPPVVARLFGPTASSSRDEASYSSAASISSDSDSCCSVGRLTAAFAAASRLASVSGPADDAHRAPALPISTAAIGLKPLTGSSWDSLTGASMQQADYNSCAAVSTVAQPDHHQHRHHHHQQQQQQACEPLLQESGNRFTLSPIRCGWHQVAPLPGRHLVLPPRTLQYTQCTAVHPVYGSTPSAMCPPESPLPVLAAAAAAAAGGGVGMPPALWFLPSLIPLLGPNETRRNTFSVFLFEKKKKYTLHMTVAYSCTLI